MADEKHYIDHFNIDLDGDGILERYDLSGSNSIKVSNKKPEDEEVILWVDTSDLQEEVIT